MNDSSEAESSSSNDSNCDEDSDNDDANDNERSSGGSDNEPTVIPGWEHSTYAHPNTDYAADRYSYIGKDEDTGEPSWIDRGPKRSRK